MSAPKIDIEKLTEQLLHSYECVILPDFGGFIIRDSPCNFNVSKDKLKPYGKHIFFNPHLLENDGLLYNEMQKAHGMTYQEAVAFYQLWLGGIRSSIADAGSKMFGQLGTFYQGNENNVWFSPLSTLNLSVDSYGLFPVDVRQVAYERMSSEDILLEKEIIEVEEHIHTLADNRPIESFEPARLNYKGWLVAASIALIAHIGYLNFEPRDITVNEASVIPVIENKTPAFDSIEIADSASVTPQAGMTVPENTAPELPAETIIAPETAPVQVETIKVETPAKVETAVPQPVPAAPVEQPAVPQLKVLAKYKIEGNAHYHSADLLKKGIRSEVRQNGEWYEVLSTEATQ